MNHANTMTKYVGENRRRQDGRSGTGKPRYKDAGCI